MGDAIQVRALRAAGRGARRQSGARRPDPLTRSMATVPGVSQVVGDGEALPDFDLYCPLLSLPLAFETELATIPAHIPYIRPLGRRHRQMARAAAGRTADCASAFAGLATARIRTTAIARCRSNASPRCCRCPGVDFVSLQKDVGEAQAAILREHGVTQLGQEFADFADTAAVVAMLDLVIAVDTSVAHLAGAMGKAVALAGAVLAGFPMDARAHRQSLVSDHAAVPAERDRRLGRSARAAAAGTTGGRPPSGKPRRNSSDRR